MKSQTIRIVVLFALTMLLGVVAFGQTSPLSGTVTDPKGDVVAGATVIVKNIGTGNEFRAVSTAQGLYTVPALAVGTYTVTIEAKGFKTTVVNDVKVDVGAPATVNATMELGAATETVTIQGGGEVREAHIGGGHPHGHPIDVGQRIDGVPLADVAVDARVRILRFENEAEDLLHYLKASGIEPGLEGTLTATDDDEVVVTSDAGAALTLTRSVAETVSVSADPSPPHRTALPDQVVLGQAPGERFGR